MGYSWGGPGGGVDESGRPFRFRGRFQSCPRRTERHYCAHPEGDRVPITGTELKRRIAASRKGAGRPRA